MEKTIKKINLSRTFLQEKDVGFKKWLKLKTALFDIKFYQTWKFVYNAWLSSQIDRSWDRISSDSKVGIRSLGTSRSYLNLTGSDWAGLTWVVQETKIWNLHVRIVDIDILSWFIIIRWIIWKIFLSIIICIFI